MLELPKILLASGSPRRRQLLQEAGFEVRFLKPDVDESIPEILKPTQVAGYLAEKKSLQVDELLQSNELLVTADTIVVLDNKVLNKPESKEEAFQMLRVLSGQRHTVFTGVCIRNKSQKVIFTEESTVYFKHLKDDFIQTYIETGSPMDKAGAYGIQDMMGYFGVKRIEGCYYNVMGFPLSAFYDRVMVQF